LEENIMEKKKLYVLTGFLGAGKTSLLLHLLSGLEGRKIGVIQNEFGKLSVDGERTKMDGIEMVEISRGSIFCSCLKLSFVQALAEMGKQDLEYVFVESSGLADPSNIEEILEATRALGGDVYDFKGVLCLIDSVNFTDQESLNWFHRSLRRLGVIDRLREAGAEEGSAVRIGEMEFDFVE
jgi:Obg family GTPase CgtA-like protein